MTRKAVADGAMRFNRTLAVLLIGWVLALYGWTCWFGFVNDDYMWLAQVHRAAEHAWVAAAFGAPGDGLVSLNSMRLLVRFSFYLNYLAGGQAPFGYHLVNVLLEVAATLLVWRVARVLLPSRAAAYAAALLFAAHPSQAGTVAWVVGRTELVADVFYLGALLLHLRRRPVLAAGVFALALASKEHAITFPLLAVAVDVARPRTERNGCKAALLYGLVCAVYAVARNWMTAGAPLAAAARTSIVTLVRFVPTLLSAAAQYLLQPLPLSGPAAVAVFFLGIAAALWLTHSGAMRRGALIGTLWVLLTLLPFLALLPFFGFFYFYPRLACLPSVGWSLLVVSAATAAWRQLPRRRWLRYVQVGCAAGWVIACVTALEIRNEQWRRNGVMSARIIDAVVQAVPRPEPRTLFVVQGLGPLRLGQHPWAHTPVLMFGLADALQLRFNDPTLDVAYAPAPQPASTNQPIVTLNWVAHSGAFTRVRQ